MLKDLDTLPGCLGLGKAEPPNTCGSCDCKEFCAKLRQKRHEKMAPIYTEIEKSLKRLEAAVAK